MFCTKVFVFTNEGNIQIIKTTYIGTCYMQGVINGYKGFIYNISQIILPSFNVGKVLPTLWYD
jgi:hypothetical protein